MATQSPILKVEKTFSLSVEADAYLQKLRGEKQVATESEALEALIEELIAAEKLKALDAAYVEYYDSLPNEFFEEQRDWGIFAEEQMAKAMPLDEKN